MIYEIRTYNLKPGTTQAFLKRTGDKLPGRLAYSKLGGFWYTEIGPLNQVVHIWPYDDLNQRADVRARVMADGVWPPDNNEFIVDMQSEIFNPAPFMTPLDERNIGPIYEMRIYSYRPGEVPRVLEGWTKAIEEREKLSPLVGCWYSELGALNKIVHMWAYRSFDERMKIRAEAREKGVWPAPHGIPPVRNENKILLPAAFSPMQ